jgi:hypothetical protein
MDVNFYPSTTFNFSKPNVLLIVINSVFGTKTGLEIPQNFYYKSLKEISNVDVISIMELDFSDFTPKYFTTNPESTIVGDFFISFEFLKEEKTIYNIINSKKYNHIFTKISINSSNIKYSTKVSKFHFDIHSKLVEETPQLLHYKPLLEHLEKNEFNLYNHVITCSELDKLNNSKLEYIPFSPPIQLQTYYSKPHSPKLIVIGGGNWFRFYNLYKFISDNKNKINSSIDVYCPNTDFGVLEKDISFTHFDDDFNLPPLDNYGYSIVPIEYNSGIPSKILLSLSYGIPVITTPNIKETIFKEHRHVYSFNSFEDINDLIKKDVRKNPKTYLEIKEDLNKFYSKDKCIKAFTNIL